MPDRSNFGTGAGVGGESEGNSGKFGKASRVKGYAGGETSGRIYTIAKGRGFIKEVSRGAFGAEEL
jgi:hypothetical protein